MRAVRARTQNRQWIALAAVIAVAVPLLVATEWPGGATSSFQASRVAGADRYDTAKQVAEAGYPNGSTTVLLASGTNFPDALSGSYLAGNENVPILLTDPNNLSGPTSTALSDLKTKNVTILGGSLAVSDQVANQLSNTNSTNSQGGKLIVTRMAGATRYETAAKVATSGGTVGKVGPDPTAIVTTGLDFPDAISGGPAAFSSHLPLLLTDRDQESSATENALQQLGITQILLLGGTNAVSDAVANQMAHGGSRKIVRFAGANRNDTAAQFYEYSLTNLGFSSVSIFLANGITSPGPDALAGSSLAGKVPTGILLADNADSLGTFTTAELQKHSGTLSNGTILGGKAAISDSGQAQFQSAAGGSSTTNGPITLNENTVPAGGNIDGTVNNPSTVRSVTVDGCGLANQTVSFGSASGSFTITIPAGQAGGSCTLTFTVIFNNGSPTAKPTFTISVTSTTHGLHAPSLLSVAVTRGQPPTAFDTATFTFDQTVANQTPSASNFVLYRTSGAFAFGVGAPTLAANGWTVSFPPGSADNVTLAAVDAHAVVNSAGNGNFPAAVAVTGANTNPILTIEPDLSSVSDLTQGATTFSLVFNFDKPFATQQGGGGCVPTNDVPANWNVIQGDGTETAAIAHQASSGPSCGTATTVRATFNGVAASLNLVGGDVKQGAVRLGSSDIGNPLMSAFLPNGSAASYPVLQAAQEIHNGDPSTNVDFIFGGSTQPAAPVGGFVATNFKLIEGDGTQATPTGTITNDPNNHSALTATFASTAVAKAVGVAVASGAIAGKFPDSSAPLNSAATQTGGQVFMPQLVSVAITSAKAAIGPTVVFTFNVDVSKVTFDTTVFELYTTDGAPSGPPTVTGNTIMGNSTNTRTVVFSCQIDMSPNCAWNSSQVAGMVAGGIDKPTGKNPPITPEASFEATVDGNPGGTTSTTRQSTSTSGGSMLP